MDMGTRVVETPVTSERVHLYQALPLGLEERARILPPMDDPQAQLSPSFLEAPGAKGAVLRQLCKHALDPATCPSCCRRYPPLPPVVVFFCAPAGLSELRVWNKGVAETAYALFRTTIRQSLVRYGGYEAQESGGAFLVAFSCPCLGMRWALRTSFDLMLAPWPNELLEHPYGKEVWGNLCLGGPEDGRTYHCTPTSTPSLLLSDASGSTESGSTVGPAHPLRLEPDLAMGKRPSILTPGVPESGSGPRPDERRVLLFRGLRAQMGGYEGAPTRVRPHHSTGRADYFGACVNRAARISYAVAAPGQMLADLGMVVRGLRALVLGGARVWARDPRWLAPDLDPGGLAELLERGGQRIPEAARDDPGPPPPPELDSAMLRIEFFDVGLFALKGVLGKWRLVCAQTATCPRAFPDHVPKRKGVRLEAGSGRVATADLPADCASMLANIMRAAKGCGGGARGPMDGEGAGEEPGPVGAQFMFGSEA